MSIEVLHDLPPWAIPLIAGAHLAAGLVLGAVYFMTLSWQARRFATGGHAAAMIALMLLRFLVLGGLLTLASLEGALPLLMMALGVLVARALVMRRLRGTAP